MWKLTLTRHCVRRLLADAQDSIKPSNQTLTKPPLNSTHAQYANRMMQLAAEILYQQSVKARQE
jgi:hypothetical protein